MTQGPGLSREEKQKLALRCFQDKVLFCKTFLPHLFPKPIPWFHRGILAILTRDASWLPVYGELNKICKHFFHQDGDGVIHQVFRQLPDGSVKMTLGKFTLLMVPRGYSKTTIAGIAVPLSDILYKVTPFTVYVSEGGKHAEMQLDNVKRELIDNPKIKAVFGDLQPKLKDPERWAHDFFETKHGIAMAARGRGSQVRGLLHRGQRPVKILVDDVEDKESVSTEAQRQKTIEWAYGDLKPALAIMNPDANITALGTMLHPECLLPTWSNDPEWTVVKFGARLPNGELLWPDRMDDAALESEKLSYTRAGMLHVYYMEYFNESRPSDLQTFKPEYIRWEVPDNKKPMQKAIFLDPAISERRRADEATITVAGIHENGRIYILESWGKRGCTPRELVDQYFQLAMYHKPSQCGVESNSYQAALVHLIREEMFRHNYYFEVVPVTHHTKKEERIMGILQPRYAAGYIAHIRRFPELEAQLLDFRPGIEQHDDYIDSEAGAIALLDPYAAHAVGEVDLAEDEMPPLLEEIGGEYSVI